MARVSKLANPDFATAVAQAYIDGAGREQMAEDFGVHPDTITIWCRDPRVQAPAARIAQERVNRITRKIDAAIERHVQNADKLDIELLLKIRKEYLDRALKIDLGGQQNTAETINEVASAVQERPDLADALRKALDTTNA